jgi:hypothetical protein
VFVRRTASSAAVIAAIGTPSRRRRRALGAQGRGRRTYAVRRLRQRNGWIKSRNPECLFAKRTTLTRCHVGAFSAGRRGESRGGCSTRETIGRETIGSGMENPSFDRTFSWTVTQAPKRRRLARVVVSGEAGPAAYITTGICRGEPPYVDVARKSASHSSDSSTRVNLSDLTRSPRILCGSDATGSCQILEASYRRPHL